MRLAVSAPDPVPEAAVSDSALGAPASPDPLQATPLPARPRLSYPGNGERLLEVLAPHEAEAPRPRALEHYLLGAHGVAKASGGLRGKTRQDAAGIPRQLLEKERAPPPLGAWGGRERGRERLRPGRAEAAGPACSLARGPQPLSSQGPAESSGWESVRENPESDRRARFSAAPPRTAAPPSPLTR